MAKSKGLPPVHPGEVLREDLLKPMALTLTFALVVGTILALTVGLVIRGSHPNLLSGLYGGLP